MPSGSTVAKTSDRSSTPTRGTVPIISLKRTPIVNPRERLSELSQNTKSSPGGSGGDSPVVNMLGSIDGEKTLRITLEILRQLEKAKMNPKDLIENNLDKSDGYLELVGWSKGKYMPSSFYDTLMNSNLKIKRLALRGRGEWNSCHCPKEQSKCGEQIDPNSKENINYLEHLYIFRTFDILPCALLDLVARSPNLKVVRFYGDLVRSDVDHNTVFDSVRFRSSLEGVYWPWCNKRYHLPTLKTLVSRHDGIVTFYCDAETTCDFISSDKLPMLKHLSLNLNEVWNYHIPEDDTFRAIVQDESLTSEEKEAKLNRKKEKKCRRLIKALPNRIEKLIHLTQLDKVEALEIRTYDISFLEDEDDEQRNAQITEQYETYQLKFWESVAKMRALKYLAIYGAWDLDKVARELAKHGMQIEYLRTNLMPGSLMIGIRETDEAQQMDVDDDRKTLKLNLIDSTRQLVKLAKLKSFHYSCFESLADFHPDTKIALKDVSDIIWKIDCRVCTTKVVEDVLNQILRRGNQSGRSYRIKLIVEPEDSAKARFYIETVQKYSTTTSLKETLNSLAQSECKLRFGKGAYKNLSLWGIEQAEGRDKGPYEQLKATWNNYEAQFRPIDRFV